MEERDLAHFRSIPWCTSILSDPSFTITPTFSRQPKSTQEDSLIATTLSTPSTISHCLSLHSPPHPSTSWITEVRTLMTLGLGMNSGPAMLHGGIIATVMDDVIGTLLTVNKDEKRGEPLSRDTVTAYMNVKYLRPVATPQTVLVVARSNGTREGKGGRRKYLLEAEIIDGQGRVLSSADSLWIRLSQEEEERLRAGAKL